MSSKVPRIGTKIDWTKFTKDAFIEGIKNSRLAEGKTVEDFKFNKKRIRIMSHCKEVKEDCNGILYWMCRECRVQDNWAMLFAQRLARKNRLPLFVCYFTQNGPELVPTKRHNDFLINGLKEVAEECSQLNIKFYLVNGDPSKVLLDIIKWNNIGGVICEINPIRKPTKWQESINANLPTDIPFIQVDAHNIVPIWITSEKKETAARTIRPKILKKLDEYLTGFPMVSKHEFSGELNLKDLVHTFDEALETFKTDRDVELPPITWAKPGTIGGLEMMNSFIAKKLKNYAMTSGNPADDNLSRLSPWMNFGQISPQRVALEIRNFKNDYKDSVERYLEESIVRRELSDNYCFYNENYDNLDGADKWARETLEVHRKDKRERIYTLEEFIQAKTYDEIWNAAQIQVVQEGRMHGYIRMYWCKKILEWTKSPEEALKIALYLNDTYALDGNNPNGYVGVMWSICGVHDHGWTERPIFGKIRFMVFWSMRKKFDSDAFCLRYGRKIDNETAPKPNKTSALSKGQKKVDDFFNKKATKQVKKKNDDTESENESDEEASEQSQKKPNLSKRKTSSSRAVAEKIPRRK